MGDLLRETAAACKTYKPERQMTPPRQPQPQKEVKVTVRTLLVRAHVAVAGREAALKEPRAHLRAKLHKRDALSNDVCDGADTMTSLTPVF